MRKGFSHGTAPDLIRQNSGLTAPEVAELALNQGLCGSDAKDPIASLGNTLAKEVREGRLPEIRAKQVNGVLRYYDTLASRTTTPSSGGHAPPITEEVVTIRLPPEHVEAADLLVEVAQHRTRSEALAWLVAEGVRQNQPQMERVRKAVEQIRVIKQSVAL